jgi:hypothetical protein
VLPESNLPGSAVGRTQTQPLAVDRYQVRVLTGAVQLARLVRVFTVYALVALVYAGRRAAVLVIFAFVISVVASLMVA